MKPQLHRARAGMTNRRKGDRSVPLRISWMNMGTYIPYRVMMGSSEESKLKGPNQGPPTLAP